LIKGNAKIMPITGKAQCTQCKKVMNEAELKEWWRENERVQERENLTCCGVILCEGCRPEYLSTLVAWLGEFR
jgi:hypothetical protein